MEYTGTYVLPVVEDESPLARTNDSRGDTHFALNEPVRRPCILLIDDDTRLLEVQIRMLRSLGYAFNSAAKSGREALMQLAHDPDSAELIVCDLGMPGMDGIEFLQLLNASSFRGSLILFSCEGTRLLRSVQQLLKGGQLTLLGALTKPASLEAFQALLECWRPPAEAPVCPAPYSVSVAELRAATTQRQWVVHYQPQVSLKTGALVGMEALLRWNHPGYGLIPPGRFIALAEECGEIDAITHWVARNALQQRLRWRAEGLDLRLSINISMKTLSAANFWREIDALVRDCGSTPADLALEITESPIDPASSIPLENLIRLRMQRFTLSVDDFGTGHSTLAQLRDAPFNELKIDRALFCDARSDQVIRPILEGSLGIAKRMEMTAVAEGVESEQDWTLLQELGCDLAQGYFIGRPMSVARVLEWLYEWQARVPLLLQ